MILQSPKQMPDTNITQHYSVYDIIGGNRNLIREPYLIGVLPGEGIGPDLIQLCLNFIETIQSVTNLQFEIQIGGDIGKNAAAKHGIALTNEVKAFCADIFTRNGAILCGPGGDRFVYDLRKAFGLFCKIAPIIPSDAIAADGPIQENRVKSTNILIIRENLAGIYQGEYGAENTAAKNAWQRFDYNHQQITDILKVAKQAALPRRKLVAVVTKPGGVPTISRLWEEVAKDVFANSDVRFSIVEVDNACYQLIANPGD
jgi:3-isopropylmalate dehydrogenase